MSKLIEGLSSYEIQTEAVRWVREAAGLASSLPPPQLCCLERNEAMLENVWLALIFYHKTVV